MINVLIIDNELSSIDLLRQHLLNFCPQVQVCDFANNILEGAKKLVNVHLIFFNTRFLEQADAKLILKWQQQPYEIVCVGANKQDAYKAFRANAIDFLLKPYQASDILEVINKIQTKLIKHQPTITTKSKERDVLGIPTVDGFEFIPVHQIIQCEGLQSYTRIKINGRKDLISCHNIGEVKKKLSPLGFFSPHKSHLINLKKIKKYNKEGVIIMEGGLPVPLARRRKQDFFAIIPHL